MRTFRKAKGLSIAQIARAVGCSVSTYRDWEYGRAIQGEPYVKIADALGVPLVELLTGKVPNSEHALKQLKEVKKHLSLLEKDLLFLG